MQETPPLSTQSLPSAAAERAGRFIYIAAPWAPLGGGMYKVSDYLVQSQAAQPAEDAAELRPLDTRGGKSAAWSMWVLLTALAKVLWGRVSGRLAGVHVNLAERLSFVRKGAIIAFSHALGVPVVLHLHAQMQSFYTALPAFGQALVRWVFSLADVVVVIGPNARRFVTEQLRVPSERVEIVINGVPRATQPRRVPQPGGVRRVLFLGNLSHAKGVADLVHAVAQPGFDRQRLEVVVAGGKPAPFKALAQELGVTEFVKFPGWCDQAKAGALLAQSDVLVLPSYDEVLPLVILEALANGLAVVCTPVGEIPSLLTDGVDALYVKPGDVAGIAATLQRVLGDQALLERLEHNGRALYEQQFSLASFFAAVARVHRRAFGIAGTPRDPAATAAAERTL